MLDHPLAALLLVLFLFLKLRDANKDISANMVINETGGGTFGYGNPLPYVFWFVIHLSGGWIVVLISMGVLIYLCLHPFRSAELEPC
jgi:hypothetical protein